MFKRIAQKLLSANQCLDKISIEYGELLAQDDCEAILFFMHPDLEWGGGLNKAVLTICGPALDEHILGTITNPKSGEVFSLPPGESGYKALFLAVLDDWDGGNGFEDRDLMDCYRKTVEQAQGLGIRVLGIPAFGRDKRDFPHIRFARVALKAIAERLDARLDQVKIMCVDRTMMRTYGEQLEKMKRRAGEA